MLIFALPTNCRTELMVSRGTTCFCPSRPNPHSSTNGCMVQSKAPPVLSDTTSAICNTWRKSLLNAVSSPALICEMREVVSKMEKVLLMCRNKESTWLGRVGSGAPM